MIDRVEEDLYTERISYRRCEFLDVNLGIGEHILWISVRMIRYKNALLREQ
jgi:hypothetical protein